MITREGLVRSPALGIPRAPQPVAASDGAPPSPSGSGARVAPYAANVQVGDVRHRRVGPSHPSDRRCAASG